MLEYVLDTIGAGKITGKRTAQAHHTPSLTCGICKRQVLCLLEQVFPFLRTYQSKRARPTLRIYLAMTPRNGKYTR